MWYTRFTKLLSAIVFTVLASSVTYQASAAAPQPTYTPFYTADFENNSVGNTIQEFANTTTPAKTTYSNAVNGPLGGQLTVRQENQSNNKGFGGRIVNTNNLTKGKEVWVRWYEYFPSNFCFANSTNGDANGGSGKIKWLRFQYPGNSTRVTLQMDATASCTAPCNSCMTQMSFDSIIGEAMNWNNIKRDIGSTALARGQWHAIQLYMYLDDVPVSAGGNGRIRIWTNDTLVSDITDVPTLDSASSNVASIWWGNYWNGGFPADQHWYLDEIIMTSSRPNTSDSGGRRFIHPQTRVSDFGGSSQPPINPPNPPSNIN